MFKNNEFVLLHLLLLLLLLSNLKLSTARVCGDGEINRVPFDFVGKLTGEYSPAGSRSYLKIFTDLRITCDGLLNAWRFIPRNRANLAKLHLAVFRQDETHGSVFTLVGETPFSRYENSLNSMPLQVWAYLPIESQSFRVKRGDYLGLFYDQTDLYFRDAPIYYTRPNKASGAGYSELISAVNSSFVYHNQQQISMARAVHGWRTPAMTAMVITVSDGSNSYFQGVLAERQLRIALYTPPPLPEPVDEFFPVQFNRQRQRRTTTTPSPTTTTTTTMSNYYKLRVKHFLKQNQLDYLPPFRPYPMVREINAVDKSIMPFNYNDSICKNRPLDLFRCEQLRQRYFYDQYQGSCKMFWGCGPFPSEYTANNFDSITTCVDTCYTRYAIDPVCYKPANMLKNCIKEERRFFFDREQKLCVAFRGCSLGYRLGNNFATAHECNSRCAGLMQPKVTDLH